MATNNPRTSLADRFNSAFSQPSNRMFRSPTGRFTSDQLIRQLVPATAETRPEDPAVIETRISAPIAADFDQLESFVSSYTASRDFDSIGMGPPSIVDEMAYSAAELNRSSLNTRPTTADVNERATGRRALFDPNTRPEYLRNIRIGPAPEAPVQPPPLETLRDRRITVGTTGPQIEDTWHTTVQGDMAFVGNVNGSSNSSGWISGSAQGMAMPKPEFVMNSMLEKAILEMIKDKLNLKVETQWEGKNIAIKVSLRITETDEELLSDSDYVQVDSSY